jgi:hypothetical protein
MKNVVVCVDWGNQDSVVGFLEKSHFAVLQANNPKYARVVIQSSLLNVDDPIHAVMTDSFDLVGGIREDPRTSRLPIVYRGPNPERATEATVVLPESADLAQVVQALNRAISHDPKAPWWRRFWRR